ncbi:Retrovirus-related Pol polyprotein from transposon opus [Gossypium australe]|uniref:Retrovirus-related Pol polyprotein from transposon opus n=1 Tax=Gossypium australe TaxID=47621 RepID=A0A5B6VMF7_9ROSI|nr:Retrovirus-related Pol polyprotein from transposon opus [Gossypium australe]
MVIRDVYEFAMCDHCPQTRNIFKQDEIFQKGILKRIHFMGPFLNFFRNQYILLALDYVSKWIEAMALPTNDTKVVVKFLRKNFYARTSSRALISDEGSHFCSKKMENALSKYSVRLRITTAYHPQASD